MEAVWTTDWALNMGNVTGAISRTSWPPTSQIPPTNSSAASTSGGGFEPELMIPLYSTIFLLSVIGNMLVIVTLAQNRRMRTVTNVFLLNLAIADLLLGVFCMPFTLIGQLLRDFIFGAFMCRIIPYFQAVSVSVGVWTLVAISLERYFAICRPLRSRIWQTRSHAYKIILVVWLLSLGCCLPIALLSNLKPVRGSGRHKCREEWPDLDTERAYNLLLVATLLVIPLMVMGLAYWLIAARLWRGLLSETNNQRFQQPVVGNRNPPLPSDARCPGGSTDAPLCSCNAPPSTGCCNKVLAGHAPSIRGNHRRLCCHPSSQGSLYDGSRRTSQRRNTSFIQIMDQQAAARNGVRSTYTDKSVSAKKKVIRMLFVIVLEFFVCWTPLYIVNTWYVFDPIGLYRRMGAMEISFIHLMAYTSSCCNPITYCFMNEKFRNAFLNAFGCRRRFLAANNRSTDLVSASLNESMSIGRRSFKRNARVNNRDIVETSLTLMNATATSARSSSMNSYD